MNQANTEGHGSMEKMIIMKKLFILGVGAQKGGTTWLHRQLNNNSNVDLGFRKEYHILDAIEKSKPLDNSRELTHPFRDKRIKKILQLNEAGQLGKNLGSERKRLGSKYIALQLAFLDNLDHYFDYFDYLYLKNPEIEMVGDITPNYAVVESSIFRMAKRGLEEKGFTVKVIFLMRDPVERAWSLARMKKRNMDESKQNTFDEIKYMMSNLERFALAKSSYEHTITNIEKVFKQKDIYYGFYETLFSDSSYTNIQKFLGIPLKKFDTEQVFNASPKTSDMPTETNKELVNRFKSTYAFILDRFGNSMKEIWQGYKILDRLQTPI